MVQVHSVHSCLRYNFCKFWLHSSYKLRLSVFWLPDPCQHPISAYLLSRVSYLAAATTTETQLFNANNLAWWGTDHHLEKSISQQLSISFRNVYRMLFLFKSMVHWWKTGIIFQVMSLVIGNQFKIYEVWGCDTFIPTRTTLWNSQFS